MNQNQIRPVFISLGQPHEGGPEGGPEVTGFFHEWTQRPCCAVGDGSSLYHLTLAIIEMPNGRVEYIEPHRIRFCANTEKLTLEVSAEAADIHVEQSRAPLKRIPLGAAGAILEQKHNGWAVTMNGQIVAQTGDDGRILTLTGKAEDGPWFFAAQQTINSL